MELSQKQISALLDAIRQHCLHTQMLDPKESWKVTLAVALLTGNSDLLFPQQENPVSQTVDPPRPP